MGGGGARVEGTYSGGPYRCDSDGGGERESGAGGLNYLIEGCWRSVLRDRVFIRIVRDQLVPSPHRS
jgi:hypothetical protein